MQTDYVDLYQLHWPDRYAPIFGAKYYNAEKHFEGHTSFEETVQAMGDLIKMGKIKVRQPVLCSQNEKKIKIGYLEPETIFFDNDFFFSRLFNR